MGGKIDDPKMIYLASFAVSQAVKLLQKYTPSFCVLDDDLFNLTTLLESVCSQGGLRAGRVLTQT